MRNLAIVAAGFAALALGLQAQDNKPINANCPVKGEPAKPGITATFEGKVIAFCWGGCRGQFNANPASFVGRIPELKNAAKASSKPGKTGPCEMKKLGKGYYCIECARMLTEDDVRNAACKRCEKKPANIDYCIARVPCFRAVCQHRDRTSDKPFTCCFKKAVPSFYEDPAKVTYECDSCGVKGDVPDLIKHKDDCKPKFGGGLKKVCTKSGKEPHASD